jgi:hypothetical protein
MFNKKTIKMKKSVLLLAATFGVTAAFAQDLTSKKGEKILPEANDWAISLDAQPVIKTLGNIMNPNAPGGITGTGGASNYIMGKLFKDEKTAYRAILGLNFGSATTKSLVDLSTSTTTPPAQVENSSKLSTNSITLGAGLEKRRGSTRLQGYYGGMAMINFGGVSTTNTYGEALSATNTGTRLLTSKAGSTFGLNLSGFIGAEYFILPKVSIGAEYWWGLGFSSTGEGETVTESFGIQGTATTPSVYQTTTKTAGGSSFNIGGQYGTAQMFLNLHF